MPYIQGRYQLKNPSKYRGDPSNVIYRSSWELRVQKYLDDHPSVIWWSSEEIIIPYRDPVTGKVRRYYPDFLTKIKKTANPSKTVLKEKKLGY